MDAPFYNGEPGDPNAWDLRHEHERCPSCGADADDPCEVLCSCTHCQEQRLRVLDVDPEGEVA